VRLTEINLRIPSALDPMSDEILHLVEALEDFQRTGAKRLGIDRPEVPFKVKKEVTSALRRLAPLGIATDVLWTANLRALRHVITMRTAPEAEEEMRLVFDSVARIMVAEAPIVFSDFTRDQSGSWSPKFVKV
jgi:thymidylate synthase (FAD)